VIMQICYRLFQDTLFSSSSVTDDVQRAWGASPTSMQGVCLDTDTARTVVPADRNTSHEYVHRNNKTTIRTLKITIHTSLVVNCFLY